jgi:hypothetical protein
VAGPDLPALDGDAPSWRLAGVDDPAARLARIAGALGVPGDVAARPADEGGGWTVGPLDGSAASVTLQDEPTGGWWYAPAMPAGPVAVDGCVATAEAEKLAAAAGERSDPAAGAGAGVAGCAAPPVPPPAPVDVPDRTTAERLGRDVLTKLGVDLDHADLDVQADEWSATVTAWPLLDGVRSPFATTVAFGGEGALTWASGTLATPQPGPSYPRAGTAAGVERLQREEGALLAMGTAVATTPPATILAGDDRGATAPPDEPTPDGVASRPAIVDGPDQPLTVTLTSVRPALVPLAQEPGETWLVPAYAFTGDDGGERTVIAVADEYLDEQVAPSSPMPAEAVSPTTAVSWPARSATTGDGGVVVTPEQAATLVGLSEDDAASAAAGNGWAFRVVERDDRQLVATDDLRTDRVDATVAGGIVVGATVG